MSFGRGEFCLLSYSIGKVRNVIILLKTLDITIDCFVSVYNVYF